MTYATTLNALRAHRPCGDGWVPLLTHLGKTEFNDEPLPILTILESNGLGDALWSLRALGPEHDAAVRLLTCDFVERALRFVPDGEDRPRVAIETARRFARGEATAEELEAAGDAAWDAARDAGDAEREAGRDAEKDAQAAAYAASYAAECAAGAAAWAAARAAGAAAWAAAWAAGDAAWAAADAAWAAECAAQERILRDWLEGAA